MKQKIKQKIEEKTDEKIDPSKILIDLTDPDKQKDMDGLKEACNSACDYINETNQQIPQFERDVICGFKILDQISLKNVKDAGLMCFNALIEKEKIEKEKKTTKNKPII